MPHLESNRLRATLFFVAVGSRMVVRETRRQGLEKNRENREQAGRAPTKYHLVYHLRSRKYQSERQQLWVDMGHLPYWMS